MVRAGYICELSQILIIPSVVFFNCVCVTYNTYYHAFYMPRPQQQHPPTHTHTHTYTPSKTPLICFWLVVVPVLQCPVPEVAIPDQPQLTFSCPDGHVHGARCTLNCTHGYSLLGEKAAVCERDYDTHPPAMRWEGDEGELRNTECVGR